MNNKQKVILTHLLTVDNRFVDELASRCLITRNQAVQLRNKREAARHDRLFHWLASSNRADIQQALSDSLDATGQNTVKNYIGSLSGQPAQSADQSRKLVLKIQKKRAELKSTVLNSADIAKQLREQDVLNDSQLASITGEKSPASQTSKMLKHCISKGPDAIKSLLISLRSFGHATLVDSIENMQVDEAGHVLEPDEIHMAVLILERKSNSPSVLTNPSVQLVNAFQDMFKEGSSLNQQYGIVIKDIERVPFVITLCKTHTYKQNKFQKDLINKKVVKLMEDTLGKEDYWRHNKKRFRLILDVNTEELTELTVSGAPPGTDGRDCVDGIVDGMVGGATAALGATGGPATTINNNSKVNGAGDAGAGEDVAMETDDSVKGDEEEDLQHEESCCTGNGSCVEAGMKEAMKAGNNQRTQVIHKMLVEMIKKSITVRGMKQFVHSAAEIGSMLRKNLQNLNYERIRQHAPITVLHQAVLESRVDVLQVLFDVGAVRELLNAVVQDERSVHRGKNVQALVSSPAMQRVKEKLTEMVSLDKSFSWMHKAAQMGQADIVCTLLERHPHLMKKRAKDKSTPLYWAVSSGVLQVVESMVEAGSSLTCTLESGDTLLTRAVSLGHALVARYLITDSKCVCDVNELGLEQKSAARLAVQRQDLDMLKLLLSLDARVDPTIVMDVARCGSVAMLRLLLDKGLCMLGFENSDGRRPLLLAAEKGHLAMVKIMVEEGAEIDVCDRQERNLLHKAAESKNMELLMYVAKLLKERGKLAALIDQRDRYVGQERCFVVRGRDNGIPAFHYVEVERHFMHVFRQITRDGGTVDVARYGDTFRSGWGANPPPEIIAEVEQRYEISRVDATSAKDLTPLNIAILREFPDGAEALIQEFGADVSLGDCGGMTPLHMAAMRGYINIARLLIEEKGVDIDVRDSSGRNAATTAEDNRHMDVYHYMNGQKILTSEHLQQFRNQLSEATDKLSNTSLDSLRKEGKDVEREVIDKVRRLQEGINTLLYQFGSATIQEETTQ